MEEKEVCPNPNGELGICYSFDRFGDRCGCVGCPLLDTLPNGMFNEGDPLPGLSKQIDLKMLLSKIVACSQYMADQEKFPGDITLNKKECKMVLELIDDLSNRIEYATKLTEEGIDNAETAMKFYKENRENKDDYASELHLLLVRAINLDDILKALKNSSAPSLSWLYNGDRKKVDHMKEKHTCCICGEKFIGFGNNPYPLTDDAEARCCDECNSNYVIAARILGIKPDDKEAIKALVGGVYNENHPLYKAIEEEAEDEEWD